MSAEQSTVEYRNVQDFPGYRVGDDGSVWSCWKKIGRGRGRGVMYVLGDVWHRLSPGLAGKGYPYVHLRRDGKSFNRYVYRLVLEAFVGPCPNGMEARHFPDRDPKNCRLDNIRWDTHQRNDADKDAHGTRVQGVKQWMAKMTPEKVRAMRDEYATGNYTQVFLAARYGVSQTVVGDITRRKTWKHVL